MKNISTTFLYLKETVISKLMWSPWSEQKRKFEQQPRYFLSHPRQLAFSSLWPMGFHFSSFSEQSKDFGQKNFALEPNFFFWGQKKNPSTTGVGFFSSQTYLESWNKKRPAALEGFTFRLGQKTQHILALKARQKKFIFIALLFDSLNFWSNGRTQKKLNWVWHWSTVFPVFRGIYFCKRQD